MSITAEEWLTEYCVKRNIDWSKLTKAELFQLSMVVPCTIRCFRVGAAITELRLGEKCPECGGVYNDTSHIPNKYDVILQGVL